MRLVISGGPWSVWSRLEPETAEARMILEACTARGERTSGSGVDAITTLRALAARLGYPVEAPDPRVATSLSPRLVVVQRGESALYARLTARPWREAVTVIWDRRLGERRRAAHQGGRRRGERRRSPPDTWGALGFLVVPCEDAPS